MSQHAMTGSAARRARQSWDDLVAWHDSRSRATMSSPRGWLWAAVVAASFFWMSNPLVFVRIFDDSVRYTAICTAVAAVLTLPWLRLPRVPWPWLLFLALCLLSQLWTIDDASTDTAIGLYVTLTALAVVVAANCDAEVVAWGMALGGVVVVVLSIYAFEKTMWGSTQDTIEGLSPAGVGTNVNILAYTVAVALAALMSLRPRRLLSRVAWAAVFAVNAYGIYVAGSGTGYLTCLTVALAVAGVAAIPRVTVARRHAILTSTAVASLLLVLGLALVVTGLDKQLSTISGRGPFWEATVAATAAEAPALGSGWGAVWAHPWAPAPPNSVADDIYARAGFPLPHGHNFFVDILPELGALGLLLVVAMVAYAVRAVRRSGVSGASAAATGGRLALLVSVALLTSGVTEPMLTVPLGWWALTVVVALAVQPVAAAGSSGRRRQGDDRVTTDDQHADALGSSERERPSRRRLSGRP